MILVHKIEYDTFGGSPVCEHSMPCAICWTNKAVLEMNEGRFQPCWECQRLGWRTERKQLVAWKRWLGIKP